METFTYEVNSFTFHEVDKENKAQDVGANHPWRLRWCQDPSLYSFLLFTHFFPFCLSSPKAKTPPKMRSNLSRVLLWKAQRITHSWWVLVWPETVSFWWALRWFCSPAINQSPEEANLWIVIGQYSALHIPTRRLVFWWDAREKLVSLAAFTRTRVWLSWPRVWLRLKL